MKPDTAWYAGGLRWIGETLIAFADFIERPGPRPESLGAAHGDSHPEERLRDLRHRAGTAW